MKSSDDKLISSSNKLESPPGTGVNSIQSAKSTQTDAGAKPPGKLKEHLSLASTALPIAGAVGTLGVWLAATFYVGDVQIATDRPFNTLEVRVSDKKGQESVFHTPQFQLMPGKYHLEVTVDSQFKQHADIKTVFRKSTTIAVHNPLATNAQPGGATPGSSDTTKPYQGIASQIMGDDPDLKSETRKTNANFESPSANNAVNDSEDGAASSTKKRWWQFWKKNSTE